MNYKLWLIILLIMMNVTLLSIIIKKHTPTNKAISTSRITSDRIRMDEKVDEGKYINPLSSLINLNRDTIKLKDMLIDQPKLVFRYSNRHCWSCVEDLLKKLSSSKTDSIIKRNIVIIANYDEFRSFYLMHNIVDWGFESYNYDKVFQDLFAETKNSPYLMVLDSSYCTKMIFHPNNSEENLLRDYLNSVRNRFYNEKSQDAEL